MSSSGDAVAVRVALDAWMDVVDGHQLRVAQAARRWVRAEDEGQSALSARWVAELRTLAFVISEVLQLVEAAGALLEASGQAVAAAEARAVLRSCTEAIAGAPVFGRWVSGGSTADEVARRVRQPPEVAFDVVAVTYGLPAATKALRELATRTAASLVPAKDSAL